MILMSNARNPPRHFASESVDIKLRIFIENAHVPIPSCSCLYTTQISNLAQALTSHKPKSLQQCAITWTHKTSFRPETCRKTLLHFLYTVIESLLCIHVQQRCMFYSVLLY